MRRSCSLLPLKASLGGGASGEMEVAVALEADREGRWLGSFSGECGGLQPDFCRASHNTT